MNKVAFNSADLFGMALHLQAPWYVKEVIFGAGESHSEVLELRLDFTKGAQFSDETGALCAVHDTVERVWQHLNFFQHGCMLRCRVPRIRTTAGKVTTVGVPWARPGSGFTLLFEAYAMFLIEREMPVNRVGETMRVHPHRIWTLFNHWMGRARAADDLSGMKKLGIDETSKKRGHDYVTVAVDMDARRVIHVTDGKGKKAVESIGKHLDDKGVARAEITDVSMDLSPAFIAGAAASFPSAAITFDRFHVVKLLNEAMDKVRKDERQEHAELKGHKYTFLKNRKNLSEKKEKSLAGMIQLYPTLGNAYRLKVLFNDLWEMPDKPAATTFLTQWCNEVEAAKIPAFMTFAKTVKAHWSGIIHFVQTRISNGILEGINSKIQLAKRRARGYRTTENFINMIHFLCGKLKFDYPRYSA